MQFKIQQLALCPKDPARAVRLLKAMGAGDMVDDIVTATGSVKGEEGHTNKARLRFDYKLLRGARELEVLQYQKGYNWMDGAEPRASHIGMHCTEKELDEWKKFFAKRKIRIVQEVHTKKHTNNAIAGKRWYHYCIFDTYDILSVDVKFIVRKKKPD